MVAAWLIVPVAAYGNGTDLSPYLGIVVLLAVGAAVGLVNGLLIVKGRLNGFVVTLGMTIVLTGLFLRYHRTGRAIYAVGGNPAADRAAGIKFEQVKIGVYIVGSVLAAIG